MSTEPVRRKVATAQTLVGSAHDVLIAAEGQADDRISAEIIRTMQADCTALMGRLIALEHRLEHPRDPAA